MSRTGWYEATLQTHSLRLHEPRDEIEIQGRSTAGSEAPERLPTADFSCKSDG
jgi:hypothetical protein